MAATGGLERRSAMKALTTVAMYGLVPLPPMQGAHALCDNDDQPPKADDANAALLAWYRHLATSDGITRARIERDGLEAADSPHGLATKHVEMMPERELVRLNHDPVPAVIAVQPGALAAPYQHA